MFVWVCTLYNGNEWKEIMNVQRRKKDDDDIDEERRRKNLSNVSMVKRAEALSCASAAYHLYVTGYRTHVSLIKNSFFDVVVAAATAAAAVHTVVYWRSVAIAALDSIVIYWRRRLQLISPFFRLFSFLYILSSLQITTAPNCGLWCCDLNWVCLNRGFINENSIGFRSIQLKSLSVLSLFLCIREVSE